MINLYDSAIRFIPLMLRIKLVTLFLILFQYTYSQTNTWTGSGSNRWHMTCNWSLSLVPTCLHDVVIPTGAAPDIETGVIAHCKTIALQGTAVLDIQGTGKLEVSDANTCVGTKTSSSADCTWSEDGSWQTLGMFNCIGIPCCSPFESYSFSLSNSTACNITVDLSAITKPFCASWGPSTSFVIPAGTGTFWVSLSVDGSCCCCVGNTVGTATWTSATCGSGTFTVELMNNL